MTGEQLLIVVLSVASTLSVGLSTEGSPHAGRLAGWALLGVVAINVVVLPAVAWGLSGVLDLRLAGAGLLVAAAAPGGSTGPLLGVVAGGDLATAARLFVITTVVGTLGALGATLAIDGTDVYGLARATAAVAAASLVPLAVGRAVRARRPARARLLSGKVSALSVVLLALTISMFGVRHAAQAAVSDLLVATVLVLISFSPALLVAGRSRRIAVAQVSATRNLTLALLVLAALDVGPRATMAVLGYGLVMYVATGTVALVARWRAASGVTGP